ncbi:MAG: single-stranded-DNA-specific exonuclease [Acidimicrobiales bacterium]|jgi:single-stranded-DNA-specific exonuclease
MVSYGIMTSYRMADTHDDTVKKELQSYSPFLQQLLYTRGIKTQAAAQSFLNPSYVDDLHDPFLLHDMDVAVERILKAVTNNEQIVIYSDYDCDGIPGAVVLHDFFKAITYKNFKNHIPHRHYDGFGLNVSAVEKLATEGAELIITIDCGTTDIESVARANELGVDVIITDHHQAKELLPEAVAIVNPQLGDTYPFKGLCGAGVIFKVVQALIAKGDFNLTVGWEKWWLDMVAIATIADMVPLRDENRALAHYGLQVLRKSRRPGLQMLLRKQKADQRYLTEDDIGFTIGPRINAASRMDTPEDAFSMLATTDEGEAGAAVEHLEKLNNERKGKVSMMTKEVHKRMKAMVEIPDVLVLGNPDWRPSLVGLTANKLAEEYNCPAFVWGRDGNGKIKGSCRSNGASSVIAIMEGVSDLLHEFGGHHMAGGFGVQEEHIHTLPQAMNDVFKKLGNAADIDTQLVVDAELTLDDITSKVIEEQKSLAPFGMDNPKPLYKFTNVKAREVAIFGKTKEHTKLQFDTKGYAREAIAFFKKPEDFTVVPEVGAELTLLAHLEQSYFMGRLQTRLRIVDIVE